MVVWEQITELVTVHVATLRHQVLIGYFTHLINILHRQVTQNIQDYGNIVTGEKTISDLKNARVTDAVITSGELKVDAFDTTLKTLVMKDGTAIVSVSGVNPVMLFAAEEKNGLGSPVSFNQPIENK